MSEMPLVSVVIPTYSRPVYLKRCVESVLKQTYSNIEILVVDDNNPGTESRLETERVMQEFRDNSQIIYLQHDKNRNGSAARNTGWRAAKGKYITFLDDDDEIAKTRIERQAACLENLDLSWGACYTAYRVLKAGGGYQVSAEKRSGECYVDALMRTMFMGSGSNLFLRKSVVDEIHGYDESFRRNQDIEFMTRALENYKLAYIDEELLTIHQEGERPQRTFEEVDGYAQYYLERFAERIDELEDDDRQRVKAVISLERFRVAVSYHRIKAGLKILKDNKVPGVFVIRYGRYIIRRILTHESYGFNGR